MFSLPRGSFPKHSLQIFLLKTGKRGEVNGQSQAPPEKIKEIIQGYQNAIEVLVEDLKEYYPKAVLLFGSLARWLSGQEADQPPNDMDILIVGNSSPFKVEKKDYGVSIQLSRLSVDQAAAIAKSLRYDSKVSSLSKLYSKNVMKQHSIDVIAACLLLGPDYREFGIEQIEVDGIIDKRDYSIHQVLYGNDWWERLCGYARERRGPWKRFSDRIVQIDNFES
jgi:hypothetical protein